MELFIRSLKPLQRKIFIDALNDEKKKLENYIQNDDAKVNYNLIVKCIGTSAQFEMIERIKMQIASENANTKSNQNRIGIIFSDS
jgi:hypothetical protein